MKILLAIDGSPCSDCAIEAVASRPWPAGSEVKLFHAIDSPIPDIPDIPTFFVFYAGRMQQLAEARKHAPAVIEQALNILRGNPQLQVTSEIVEGHAKDMILDEAERWQADLIMIGSHGYGAGKRLVLGSVSLALVNAAKCSVEVARCPHWRQA